MLEKISKFEREIIRDFNLTNTEWLRYRLTSELPERSCLLLEKRFQEQTKTLTEFHTPKIKRSPDIDFSSFEVAKSGIIDYTDNELLLSTDLHENTLKGIVLNLYKFHEDFFLHRKRPADILELNNKSNEWIETLEAKSEELPAKTRRKKALIIASLYSFECLRQSDEPERYSKYVDNAFEKEDFTLVGELLMQENDRLGMLIRSRLESYYGKLEDKSVWEKNIETGSSLLPFLIWYVNDFIEKQETITNVHTNSLLIEKVCADLGNHKDGKTKLTQKGVDIRKLGDSFLLTCINSLRNYPNQSVSHDGLTGVITILSSLYSLSDQLTKIPLEKVYDFLKPLYQSKITNFTFSYKPPEHQDFVKLAKAMKLNLELISEDKFETTASIEDWG